MDEAAWAAFDAALERAAARGPVRFWLRDDDAVEVTPALLRLADLCATVQMPVLLAVIPAGLTPALADWLAHHPAVTPCQHGVAHVNHAAAGERACELGGDRSDAKVVEELRAGRDLLRTRFDATALSDILVPPWNRIRESLLPVLPTLGFTALSTFVGSRKPPPAAVPRLDCDLDVIDWRNGRRGRSETDLCARLVRLLASCADSSQPIGLLTHHLAHDEAAWRFLESFFTATRHDNRVVFSSAAHELQRVASNGATVPAGPEPAPCWSAPDGRP